MSKASANSLSEMVRAGVRVIMFPWDTLKLNPLEQPDAPHISESRASQAFDSEEISLAVHSVLRLEVLTSPSERSPRLVCTFL
jgi:hypothetical protein